MMPSLLKNLFPKKIIQSNKLPNEENVIFPDNITDNEFCIRRKEFLREDQLRLIVIAETNFRLLFDSSTVLSLNKLLRHQSDILPLGLMLFGSMPMMKKATFKVHYLSCTNQIMVGHVISLPKSTKRAYRLVKRLVRDSSGVPVKSIKSIMGLIRWKEFKAKLNHKAPSVAPEKGIGTSLQIFATHCHVFHSTLKKCPSQSRASLQITLQITDLEYADDVALFADNYDEI
ncbi:unnamed protein product [Dracunculus medinensis]|uniref:Reverse transcriptase domain-containing protein n=1 Tax=Dracunculus medinensis TaxID=318479 RepID=A0A0N4U9G4_DRAME|nr:unnamed protein product [Dracunculus medinensis]